MRSRWPSVDFGFAAAVFIAILVGGVTGCVAPQTTSVASAATADFVGDFETGNFNQWPVCQDTALGSVSCSKADSSGYGMRVESDIVRQGRFAARFELRHGDVPAGICCGARAEVSGDAAVSAGEGDERWYQWSTRFDSQFPSGEGWSVLSQWHADADGSPPVAILANVTADRWGVVLTKWNSPSDQNPPKLAPWSAPVVRGVWTDIKMHVKWSAHDDVGFIELWINGAPQVFTDAPCSQQTRCATRTLMPGGGGVYFKQGLYRDSSIVPTGVVYHDGFSAANTEDGLVPL